MATNVQMQARSSSDGELYYWVTSSPDFAGASFPGPGTPEEIAVVAKAEGGAGGGGGLTAPASPAEDGRVAVASSGDLVYQLLTNAHIASGAAVAVSKLAAGSAHQVVKTNAAGDGVELGLLTGDNIQNASVPFGKLTGATLAAVLANGSDANNLPITNLNRLELGASPATTGQIRLTELGAIVARGVGLDLTLIASAGSDRVFVGDEDNAELRLLSGTKVSLQTALEWLSGNEVNIRKGSTKRYYTVGGVLDWTFVNAPTGAAVAFGINEVALAGVSGTATAPSFDFIATAGGVATVNVIDVDSASAAPKFVIDLSANAGAGADGDFELVNGAGQTLLRYDGSTDNRFEFSRGVVIEDTGLGDPRFLFIAGNGDNFDEAEGSLRLHSNFLFDAVTNGGGDSFKILETAAHGTYGADTLFVGGNGGTNPSGIIHDVESGGGHRFHIGTAERLRVEAAIVQLGQIDGGFSLTDIELRLPTGGTASFKESGNDRFVLDYANGFFRIADEINLLVGTANADNRYPVRPQVEATASTASSGGTATVNVFTSSDIPAGTAEYLLTVVVSATAANAGGQANKAYIFKRHDFHLDADGNTVTAAGSEVETKAAVDDSGDLADGADASIVVNGTTNGVDVSLTGATTNALDWTVIAAWSLVKVDT
jgi:hypothetical protein